MKPKIMGISVSYYTQLPGTVILARTLKEVSPTTEIILGGNFFWIINNDVLEHFSSLSIFDSIVRMEGELAWLDIIRGKDANGSDILRSDKVAEGLVANKIQLGHEIPLNEEPPPRFEGLNLDLYGPKRVIPYLVSKGCYWNRCTFCNIPSLTSSKDPSFVLKSPRKVAAELAFLGSKYDVDLFFLITTGLSPRLARELSLELIARGSQIRWFSMARIERGFSRELPKLMFEAGCRYIEVGIESVSRRVLKKMDKGSYNKELISQVIHAFYSAGIGIRADMIVDFPGTTRGEAVETFQFLLDHRHMLDSISIYDFVLSEGSRVSCSPESFGVTVQRNKSITNKPNVLPVVYETMHGMSYEEGKVVAREFRRLAARAT